jgi:hypothetical protein
MYVIPAASVTGTLLFPTLHECSTTAGHCSLVQNDLELQTKQQITLRCD